MSKVRSQRMNRLVVGQVGAIVRDQEILLHQAQGQMLVGKYLNGMLQPIFIQGQHCEFDRDWQRVTATILHILLLSSLLLLIEVHLCNCTLGYKPNTALKVNRFHV